METWKYWERMKSGEAVYITESGRIAVEKDHRHLMDARPEELFEIFQRWPELIDKITRGKDVFMGIGEDPIGELKDTIIALEFEAAENRNLIEALKHSNGERDKMIEALMGDITESKGRLLGAHETNRRWKEEVNRRDGTIEALMNQIKEGRNLENEE